MIELLNQLKKLAYRGHYTCEDSWYSCPLAEDGCADDSKEKKCDCGADDINKALEVLFKQLEDKINSFKTTGVDSR